jgi:phage terminase large subunit GpA-like protein
MDDRLRQIERRVRAIVAPPPDLTISEWADAKRRLSTESSPEPFAWRTARAEYQRGIMDAFSDPTVRRVVAATSAQVGKTSIVENVVGFHIDKDPSPILVVEPTLDMAETMSKDRFAPMLRDTPSLRGKVGDARSRDSENTLLHKRFAGGHLTLAGANSPASLASRPIRILLCDEIDRFPISAGPEGNPVKLAIKRTNNFWNRRIGLFSTPTDEDVGIDAEYKASDQRRFFVDCPECDHEQVLAWPQVKWTPAATIAETAASARYACAGCGVLLNEAQRDAMVSSGEWRATAPFNGVAGFHVNELYSPWRSFADVVTEFLEAGEDKEKLRVWVNTSLGEPWKERGPLSADALKNDAELPLREIPEGVLALTLGVDTQGNRLACQIVGWGRGLERWTIDYVELPGDPAEAETWERLTEYRRATFAHPFGGELGISITAVDSGGHHSHQVVAYARQYRNEGVIAVKGASVSLPQMLKTKPTKVDFNHAGKVYKRGGEVWFVGTDVAKSMLMSALRVDSDRRKVHFPNGLSSEFFRGLTSETYDKRTRKWIKPKKKTRNESLDTHVYAAAAIMHPWLRLDVATEQKWRKLAEKVTAERELEATPADPQLPAPAQPAVAAAPQPKPTRRLFQRRPGGGFVNNW